MISFGMLSHDASSLVLQAELPCAVFAPYPRRTSAVCPLALCHPVFVSLPQLAVKDERAQRSVAGVWGFTDLEWSRRRLGQSWYIPCKHRRTHRETE